MAWLAVAVVASTGVPTRPADAAPAITAISPARGLIHGGTAVTITGSGLSEATQVYFGATPAPWVRFEPSEVPEVPGRLVAVSPPHGVGTVVVSVADGPAPAGGGEGPAFTYTARAWARQPDPRFATTRQASVTVLPDGSAVVLSSAPSKHFPGAGFYAQRFRPSAVGGGYGSWDEPVFASALYPEHHVATLLTGSACAAVPSPPWCGQLLVTGGRYDGELVSSTALVYDPAAGEWAFAASMTTRRHRHTATALADGKVLVAGGADQSGTALAAAEIYDPAGSDPSQPGTVGSWSPAPPMDTGRARHTATALPDGSVLVAGGDVVESPGEEQTATVERYVPGAGAGEWVAAPRLPAPRSQHAAAALPDGSVLVVGHSGDLVGQRFVPGAGGAGAWVPTGPMFFHDIFGPLLAATGGGAVLHDRQHRVQRYEAATDTWVADEVPSPGTLALAGLPGDRVLAVGCCRLAATNSEPERSFDNLVAEMLGDVPAPPPPVVATVAPAAGPSAGGTAVTLTGGGLFGPATSVQFGEAAGTVEFASENEMRVVSPPHAAGIVDVVVTTPAGRSPPSPPPGTATRFHFQEAPSLGGWTPVGAMATPRELHTATLLDRDPCGERCGQVLVVGGRNQTSLPGAPLTPTLASSELYDPLTRAWSEAASLLSALPAGAGPLAARYGHSATMLQDGRVLVAGGCCAGAPFDRGTATPTALVYDPVAGSWQRTGDLGAGRMFHSATLLASGQVLVAGGQLDSHLPDAIHDSAELYDPGSGTWSPVDAPMAERRTLHAALALPGPGDRVLIAGGTGGPVGSSPLLFQASAAVYDDPPGPAPAAWLRSEEMLGHRRSPAAFLLPDGTALMAGGAFESITERYDPTLGAFVPAGALHVARPATEEGGHAGAQLQDGSVLLAGGLIDTGPTLYVMTAASELYEPEAGGPGRWVVVKPMTTTRAFHTLTTLPDGRVLAAGGRHVTTTTTATSEIFTRPPRLMSLEPATGPSDGGSTVVLVGHGVDGATEVRFGEAAVSFRQVSSSRLEVEAPAHPAGPVAVTVSTAEGTSDPLEYLYRTSRPPGRVGDLTATATSPSAVDLRFSAVAGDGPFPPPATRYQVRRAATPIADAADFDSATQLCECVLSPAAVGAPLTVSVTDLALGQTHHFAVRAVNEVGVGAVSNSAAVTTDGPPRPASVDPPSGPSSGATTVAIAGEGMGGATEVRFGDQLAAFTVRSSTLIEATAPEHASGTVAVRVTNTTGTSAPVDYVYRVSRPPGRVSDLTATPTSPTEVQLRFSAAPGDGPFGPPAGRYRIAVAAGPIVDDATFATATLLCECAFGPATVGQALTVAISDLPSGTVQHFAVRAVGELGPGPVSNPAAANLASARARIAALDPPAGPSTGATPVTITGTGLADTTEVRFGGQTVPFEVRSPSLIVVMAPAHPEGEVEVRVTNPAGTADPLLYAYAASRPPGPVGDLTATATSPSEVELRFAAAPGDGTFGPPARRYQVRRSERPITDDAGFEAASSLCECSFGPAAVGDPLVLAVGDLAPGTTYYFVVRAVSSLGTGPRSNPASVTTAPFPPPPGGGGEDAECSAAAPVGPGQVAYPAGYSLIGLPAGSVWGAGRRLYGWHDRGAGGTYDELPADAALPAGQGAWAWSPCPRVLDVGGPSVASHEVGLGAFHASLVGNPTGAPVVVTGHDWAAAWDPAAGAYRYSSLRGPLRLAPGEGAWVFAYRATTIKIGPEPSG